MRSLIRSSSGALISAASALCLAVTPTFCPALAMDPTFALQAEARAKQSNDPKDWNSAGNSWYSAAKFGEQDDGYWRAADLPGALEAARRAVGCLQKSFNMSPDDPNTHRGIEFDSRLKQLMGAYDLCARLDPKNGLWYYLAGEQMAGLGHYREADANLIWAEKLGSGSRVGQSASALRAHIAPFVKRDDENHSADSPNMGALNNMLQNQTGGSSQRGAQIQADLDRNRGVQSHGYSSTFRTDGNVGN